MPSKANVTQDQRMYELVKSEGVESAIKWYKAKGKPAVWGGTHLALANQLIQDGRIDDGLRLMEFDVESSPGKVWLLRKTAKAFLDSGDPEKALLYTKRGLEVRPEHEDLKAMLIDAEKAVLDANE
jgi:tetratricopeptide (TPR) repeat protein